MGAGLGQRVRRRAPDAAAAAREQRHAAIQPQQPEIVGHRHPLG
jgi:hypothetical protein